MDCGNPRARGLVPNSAAGRTVHNARRPAGYGSGRLLAVPGGLGFGRRSVNARAYGEPAPAAGNRGVGVRSYPAWGWTAPLVKIGSMELSPLARARMRAMCNMCALTPPGRVLRLGPGAGAKCRDLSGFVTWQARLRSALAHKKRGPVLLRMALIPGPLYRPRGTQKNARGCQPSWCPQNARG